MNEKDLLEQLKDSAKQITPPESLHPSRIETLLKNQQASENNDTPRDTAPDSHQDFTLDSKQTSETASPAPSGDSRKPRRRISIYRLGRLAAAFAVAILGAWQAGRLSVLDATSPAPSVQVQSAAPEDGKNGGSPQLQVLEEESSAAAEAPDTTSGTVEADTAEASDSAESAPNTVMVDQAEPEVSDDLQDTADSRQTSTEAPLTEALDPAGSYEAIYDALYDTFGSSGNLGIAAYGAREDIATTDVAVESAMDTGASIASSAQASNIADETSYSTTNTQEANVDEGDLVKTDGTWIYLVEDSGSLIILDAAQSDGGREMAEVSRITLKQGQQPQEIYVDGDRLSVIASEYYSEMDDSDANVIAARSGMRTWLFTYDITDRENPVLEGSVSLDGTYSQSRKYGDYIYLFARYSPTILDTYEESQIVPRTSQGPISADQIYLPDYLSCSSYLVAASVNIQDPGQIVDQKAVVSVASTFYVSEENIYITNENWDNSNVRTNLLKLSYRDGIIVGTAAGYLDGYLNDSFSLSEYNGYLRTVTTSYDENYNESNGLYILDEELNVVGSITDLAPGETVRSARFLGDVGYFVTFRQTDPLFSVDLSDPANPRILGDLKISGFSTYLHFYSENLLLGLGYEADEETGVQTGLKLSMFDISDPANVTEVHKLVLDGITWCEALDDYKSILIDPEKNLFGFTCDNRYLVFSYDEEQGFVSEFIYDFYRDIISDGVQAAQDTPETTPEDASENTDGSQSTQSEASTPTASMDMASYLGVDAAASFTRGLYINDTLYLVRPGRVLAFDMADGYQLTGELALS